MTDTLVSCTGVTRRFGGLVANDAIDMTIARGEILGLIGPNGAGKSTLFNLIAGAFPPSSGTITFEGRDVTTLPATARCVRGIARTYQVPRSFDSMTVVENVIVGAFVRHPRAAQARAKALEVLDYVGLAAQAGIAAADLTPPQKRRLEVARALATEPKLLLLDEVLTGLTPSESRAGAELIRAIRDSGVTVVMVEHVMEVVMPLVDRAVVLNLGKVLAEGAPKDVVRDENVIAAYLGDRHRAA
ncbi:ABC transporter ATP-binding protein [Bradyrhizobium sp. U87765 SZCCT0131]|uniref:ABC transporter ATP-binding protein n=1 Tax=unclassified Bradyrhizobium TaxID=2631580 RepID=UPI001BA84117|nr:MULTISPECIES: ABC transporter ATP-binding protein [unclassified Bradyrhizobium]MBR1217567.1 ABC transporter ATP-binding protein [Bradyrhizobium sp. U87765 SZCCT0131]MBR1264835.1 ABC transporter ATP-binding protein [Bradyrhizobium sp. U87765 SZCCT0134]MBR1304817.1 ABC transporter ATP-binding protein [Bradyrhizobium sp. U87765 SZCCT0110]MBR1320604.1 ABC transporter ATP-binding protein [Bradyrhizobium sp. U87765 SZCCT0109]MBR1349024.1 ABC transporter ATP-binding protein [Bradyrhizobium sp. U87